MRIINFPKLVNNESERYSLRNCSVVIDGRNFFHYVYENSKIPFIFGCEANVYAKRIMEELNMFKQGNVRCYIVLKGGDRDIEKKIKKFFHLTYDFDSDDNEFIAPVFIKDVKTQVLDEMNIGYAVCLTESKDECVALAQKLNCPIISFDVEYCFRKALYVPYTTMLFDRKTNSIKCRQYKRDDFLRNNSLNEEKFALFGALCNVHTFPLEFFEPLFKTWGVFNENRYILLKNLIKWLSENSEDHARNGISNSFTNDGDRNTFWANYENILQLMRKDDAPGCVTNYLIDSKLTIVRQDPKWFEKGVASKYISIIYVNLYKWKVIEGSWVTRDKSSRDSLYLSIDIIKYAYNLLTNFKGDQIKLYQDADNHIVIDTEDLNLTQPSYNCIESVFENGWSQVKRFKLFEHFLNENKISTEVLMNVPAEATVLFVALVYFTRKKLLDNVDVTKEVYAVLLSYVMLNVVFDRTGSYKKIQYKINQADCNEAKFVTAGYFKFRMAEARRIFNDETLKRFVEFQYCLQHLNYLNILCGSTYETTKYHRAYNGTFVFKIYCAMRDKENDVFVNDLFQSAPSVLAFVWKLINFYKLLLTTE